MGSYTYPYEHLHHERLREQRLDDLVIEYRVMVGYREFGEERVYDRPENPFADLRQAQQFAAQFKPPKFTRAWVERRRVVVGEWESVS